MISRADLALFQYVDDPATAFELLKARLTAEREEVAPPDFARSRTSDRVGD